MTCYVCREEKPTAQMVRDSRAILRGWKVGECKACKRIRSRSYSPERKRGIVLRKRYGITVEEYDALLAAQDGCCAICRKPPREGSRLYVDHDHETNQVRGLLCPSCNTSLEWMLIHLEEAEQYVRGLISK